ncbi:DeoR/GlpR family DNA-binding transcription regulator [Virgibacillus dakarensis]|uniref:hypothetical protein n=1 Tax=Virgibacillus dakarensis TaxID=1917889 RepID=UPI001F387B1C|nr:hypothetical protein [Virgibacillus dakarensis]
MISCKGLHVERGISESNEQQALIKKKMIEIADTVYVMVDYSKFGVQAFSRLSGIESIDHIITNSNVDDKVISQLNDKSMHLIRV